MISEFRYVMRSLVRRKGFAFVTLLTLALGIGSATAIYSVVDWTLFRKPLSPPGVYAVGSYPKEGDFTPYLLVPYYEGYRAQKDAFSDMAVGCYRQGNVVVDHEPVQTTYIDVSTNFLNILGAQFEMGRGFITGEDIDGRDQEIVVTHQFWKNSLGGSPEALGLKIIVNQQQCTVIGVLKQGQRMPPFAANTVYHPLVLHFDPSKPWDPFLFCIAKVPPTLTRKQVEGAMLATKVDMDPHMNWMANNRPGVATIAELQRIYRPEFYWTLVGAVGFLYAIACLNGTNLMLVHMLGKQREISVRLALGGGRWRIVRLLIMETLALSVCGSLLGALIANELIPFFNMAASSGGDSTDLTTWHLYWRTYLVLGGLSLLTGLLISLVPAVHVMHSDITTGLKNGGGAMGESPRLARLRGMFVILQATFAVILLIGAGLMIESFKRLQTVDVGFDPSHRVKLQLGFPKGIPDKNPERLALLERLRERFSQQPGVVEVAYSSEALMAQYDMPMDVLSKDGVTPIHINPVYISSNYKAASGMVLKAGRWISPEPKNEVLVSESLAKLRFGSTAVVGEYLMPVGINGTSKGWHIVGVVGDIKQRVRDTKSLGVYVPITWSPQSANNFIVKLGSEPSGKLLTDLRQAVFQFDPRIVIDGVDPIASLRMKQMWDENLALSVLKVLAGIAVFLTIVGMFSVLAYTVDRRMPEFGIRMALGASPGNLLRLVLRRGIALTAIGIVVGIGGALALTRFLHSLLFESPPFDPAVISAVSALLLISALCACILPATRASKPDLVKLLKSD
jgi:predicted permease